MKEKILKVIHTELENIDEENVFLRLNKTGDNYYPINPIVTKVVIKYKTFLPNDWSNHNVENENFECLQYLLTFEDGNPPIEVDSVINTNHRTERIRHKFLGIPLSRTKETAFFYTNTIEVRITCGEYSFILTEDEKNDLIERTKFAYQRYKIYRAKKYEEEITNKLDLRLKKWEKPKK